MNNNIQCSIESSTTSMELNSAADGIFLVPELEGLAGLPEIRTTSGVNAGYDGGWTSAQNYDARLIAIRGVIANKDIAMVEAMRRKLASLLGQGRKEQLTLRFTTEAGNAYTISVRTISCEMALQRVLNKQDFLIQLRADDPLIYDDGASGGTEAILRVQQALGGFEINFGLPLAIGGSSDATAVENGAETVYPIIKLYGPLHSPTVVNMTTNQQMQIIADLGYTINWSGWTGVSGERIAIPNELDKEAPLRLWSVDGNIEQTTYTGKNLLRNAYQATQTISGVTITSNADGTITANGTATNTINFFYNGSNTQYSISEGTYTLSTGTTDSDTTYFTIVDKSFSGEWSTRYASTRTITVPSGGGTIAPRIVIRSNATLNNVVFKPMIEVGSSATSFEKYVGGIPAPNPQFPQPIETVTGRQTVTVAKNYLETYPTPSGTITVANVAVTLNSNGTLTLNGTCNGNGWVEFVQDFRSGTATQTTPVTNLDSTKTYTITIPVVSGTVSGTSCVVNMQFSSSLEGGANIGGSRTITGADGIYRAWVRLYSGAIFNNAVIAPMITEEAQTQEYEINLGKNLIEPKMPTWTYHGVTCTNNGDGSFTLNGTATATATWRISQSTANGHDNMLNLNGTYTLSCGGLQNGMRLVVTQFNVWQTVGAMNDNDTPATFTTDLNDLIIYVAVIDGTTVNNVTIRPMLEKGSTASSYSAYFAPIELCKIGTYQDRIYKENGKWWLEKQTGKVVLNGSEDWHKSGNTQVDRYWYNIYSGDVVPSFHQIYSDKFFYVYNVPTVNAMWVDVYQTLERLFVNYAPYNTTAVADLKTWLASNPTTVYYVLATPTTTEITNEEVLEGLEAIGDATLYVGTNNIYADTPSALPTLEVDYPTDYDETHDTIIIDSQARTITLNGADIYHLKTEESEFPVLAPGENRMYLTSATTSDTGYAEVKFKQGYLSI